jgi:Ca2+-binding RTX toxin-like protein
MMPIRLARRSAAKSTVWGSFRSISKKIHLRAAATRELSRAVIETLEKRAYLSGITFLGTKGGLALNDLGSFSTASDASAIAVGDFNGDGKMDLVTATASGQVGISLGNGDGTFAPVNTFSDGLSAGTVASVAVANLNGSDDIIAADGTRQVSILLNSGTGTFPNVSQINFERNVDALAVGDLNGDGTPDLVVGYQFGGIGVSLGNGGGTFNASYFYSVGFCTVSSIAIAQTRTSSYPDIIAADDNGGIYDLPSGDGPGTFGSPNEIYFNGSNTSPQIATGDLNGEGIADVAVTTRSRVVTLLSNGDGTFKPAVPVLDATGIDGVALAHVGGDGNLDLIAANTQTGNVTVLLGNGDGTFTGEYSMTEAVGNEPAGIVAADFTNDGKTDLAVVNPGSSNVTVVLNNSAGVGFHPATNLATGNGPNSVAIADLNNDGNMDVVVADQTNSTVQVFLGEGDGAFAAPETYTVPSGPTDVIATNLGNGHYDIVVTSPNADAISVLMGNGSGHFQAARTVIANEPISYGPTSIAAADFLDSGKEDLVVADGFNAHISVFYGNGDGTFNQSPSTYSVGDGNGYGVATGLFDADSFPDIAAIDSSTGAVYVFLNNGTNNDGGQFGEASIYSVGSDPTSVATGAVLGDGNTDIVVTDKYSNAVNILGGNGLGGFPTSAQIAAGQYPFAVAIGDVNGDGNPDLIVANSGGDSGPGYTVTVLLSNGDGTFSGPLKLAVGNDPQSVAVADLNGDNNADIVTANINSDNVSVLLTVKSNSSSNSSSNTAQFVQGQNTGVGNGPLAVVSADLTPNSSANADLVVADRNSKDIEILMGNGDGRFAAPVSLAAPNYPSALAIADFNGDGIPDIVVGSSSASNVTVFLGNGDGTFKAGITTVVPNGVSYVAGSLAAADFTGDGKMDLAVAGGFHGYVDVLIGNGDGTFSNTPQVIHLIHDGDSEVNGYALSVAAGDLVTGDNHPDLIVTDTSNNTIDILLNNGSGGFRAPVVYSVGRYPNSIALGNLNGDGNLDIVVSNEEDRTATVLLGNGDGTFAVGSTVPLGNTPGQLALADVNGDHRLDIISVNTGEEPSSSPTDFAAGVGSPPGGTSQIDVLLGNGNGTFAAPATVSAGNEADALAIGDFNGDGKPDVAVASYSGNSVDVLLNNYAGHATVIPPSTIAVGSHPDDVVRADVNNDGIADLIVANKNSNTVEIFLGNGDGTFKAPTTYTVANGPSSIYVVDVNGDGKPDIVVASAASQSVSVLLGNGDGTFKAPIVTSIGHVISPGPDAIAMAKFTSGGPEDLIIAEGAYGTLDVLSGNGDGTFQTGTEYPVFTANNLLATVYAVAVAKLGGDTLSDVVLTDTAYSTVDVMLNNGDGTLAAPKRYSVGNGPTSVTLADVNNDGIPDIITANSISGSVSVLLGNSGGTFKAAENLAAGNDPFAVSVADVTGDGNADIITADPGTSPNYFDLVTVIPGNGDGTFGAGKLLVVGNGPDAVAAGDLNGDGVGDIVTANSQDNDLTLLEDVPGALESAITLGPGNIVQVTATPNNDNASITYANGVVTIVIDGLQESFPIGSINGINVNLEGGNDSISVGEGVPSCTINGGAGDDTIMAMNSANDMLLGGSGNDSIEAGSGKDTLHGGAGNDTLIGGGRGSKLNGNGGNDYVVTNAKLETVKGGRGMDTLDPTSGGDSLLGGAMGAIFLDAGAKHPDSLAGVGGLNFAQNNPADVMTNIFEIFDPPAPPASSGPTTASPAIALPAAAATVTDAVTNGTLKVVGASGNNVIALTTDGTNIDITANGNSLAPVPLAGLNGIRVKGGSGNNSISVAQAITLPATLRGHGGADTLVGGGGDNVLIGGGGNDSLVGGADTNLLVPDVRNTFVGAPAGNVTLDGGTGFSIADFSRRTDSLHLSNDGSPDSGDTAKGEADEIKSNVSAIWGGTAADTIVGTTSGVFLSGGGSRNSIQGGGANDLLVGGLGHDTVAVAAEPVSLYLLNGKPDDYSGVNDPSEDILQLDPGIDVELG